MSLRFLIIRTAIPLIACAAIARAATADQTDRPQSVGDAAMSGATRGALAGGIAGGLAGFFALAKKVSASGRRVEEPNNDKPGRPYF
jgi:hypothetical protein